MGGHQRGQRRGGGVGNKNSWFGVSSRAEEKPRRAGAQFQAGLRGPTEELGLNSVCSRKVARSGSCYWHCSVPARNGTKVEVRRARHRAVGG